MQYLSDEVNVTAFLPEMNITRQIKIPRIRNQPFVLRPTDVPLRLFLKFMRYLTNQKNFLKLVDCLTYLHKFAIFLTEFKIF